MVVLKLTIPTSLVTASIVSANRQSSSHCPASIDAAEMYSNPASASDSSEKTPSSTSVMPTPVVRRSLRVRKPATQQHQQPSNREAQSRASPSSLSVSKSRRRIGGGTDKNSSDRSTTNTTNSSAASTPNPRDTPQSCFMCGRDLPNDILLVNAHIDACLQLQEDPGNVANDIVSSPQRAAVNPAQPEGYDDEDDQQGPVVEYEWAGQRRIRATALLEGGIGGTGIGAAVSSKRKQQDVDDDIDVDEDDEENYGPSQYSDKDIMAAIRGKRQRQHHYTTEDDEDGHCSDTPSSHDTSKCTTGPNQDRGLLENPASTTVVATFDQATSTPHSPAIDNAAGSTRLVIESLKSKIRDQERMLASVSCCMVCFEPYEKPCVSVACWHVHCEQCWLKALGNKKLCPQCQKIVQPTDLRRIYL